MTKIGLCLLQLLLPTYLSAAHWSSNFSSEFANEIESLAGEHRISAGTWAGPSYPDTKLRAMRWAGAVNLVYQDGDSAGKRIAFALVVNASENGKQRVASFVDNGPAILLARMDALPTVRSTLTRRNVFTFTDRFHVDILQYRTREVHEFHSEPDAHGRTSVVQIVVSTLPGGPVWARLMLFEGQRTGTLLHDLDTVPPILIQMPPSTVAWGDIEDPFVPPEGGPIDLVSATFEIKTRFVATGEALPTCPATLELERRRGLNGGAKNITQESP